MPSDPDHRVGMVGLAASPAGNPPHNLDVDLARMQRVAGVGCLDIDVAGGLRSWRSPEYLRLHGLDPALRQETHADWRARVHPNDVEQAECALFDALNGDADVYDSEYRIVRPSDGAVRWIHAQAEIERDQTGLPVRLLGAHTDVTARRQGEALLAGQREALEVAVSGAPLSSALAVLQRTVAEQYPADVRTAFHLAEAHRHTLGARADGLAGPPSPLTDPPPFAVFAGLSSRSAGTGDPDLIFDVLEDPRGTAWRDEARRMDYRACWNFPIRPRHGECVGAFVLYWREPRRPTNEDMVLAQTITRSAGIIIARELESSLRAAAEAALRASEDRHAYLLELSDALRPIEEPFRIQHEAVRILAQALDAAWAGYGEFQAGARGPALLAERRRPGAVAATDVAAMTSAATLRELRAGRAVAVGDISSSQLLSPAARRRLAATDVRAYAAAPVLRKSRLVAVLVVADSRPRDWSEGMSRLLETAARTSAAVEHARAGQAVREREARLRVLTAELQHRVRNILTVIRSVFTQTVATAEDLEGMAEHFRGRLDALARTQVTVTRTAAGTADLQDMLRDELVGVGVSDGAGLRISGPDVALPAKTAEMLGLAFHELTTNALKYGALRSGSGRLDVTWTVDLDDRGVPWLHLLWAERGVPAVILRPQREGFGRELIEQALPYRLGAQTRLEFRGGGVRCSIALPLSRSDPAMD